MVIWALNRVDPFFAVMERSFDSRWPTFPFSILPRKNQEEILSEQLISMVLSLA